MTLDSLNIDPGDLQKAQGILKAAIFEELKKKFSVGGVAELANHIIYCLSESFVVNVASTAWNGTISMTYKRYDLSRLLPGICMILLSNDRALFRPMFC